jgi:hypothetical protein
VVFLFCSSIERISKTRRLCWHPKVVFNKEILYKQICIKLRQCKNAYKLWQMQTDHLTWRFFVSFRIFFLENTRVRIFIFCRAKCNFFFQNLTLGYMTKTLNRIIFSFLHQNQNIFFSNIGNQNLFCSSIERISKTRRLCWHPKVVFNKEILYKQIRIKLRQCKNAYKLWQMQIRK